MKNISAFFVILFLFASCEKEGLECPGQAEKSFDITGFNAIKAGGTFSVSVTKGVTCSVVAKGCADDIEDLELTVLRGGVLDLRYKHFNRNRYRVDFIVTMPELDIIVFNDASKGSIQGFASESRRLNAVLSGTAMVDINGTPVSTQANLSGAAVLNLSGQTDKLTALVDDAATLNAFEAKAAVVDVLTEGTARARVTPLEKLYASASAASIIYFKGNPVTTSLQANGAARILRQQ